MKWLAAILMIVNVAIYLWVSGEQITVDDIANAPRPDVNKEGMLLLIETSNSGESGGDVGDEQTDSQQTEIVEIPDDSVESPVKTTITVMEDTIPKIASVEQTNELALNCYRIGPFKGSNGWNQATQWMQQNKIKFQHVTSDSRELRAVRVFLGPFDTISNTEPVVQTLTRKNLDHFVYLVEEGHARISLGYFTQEELATKFLAYLQSLNVNAKSQPEYRRLGPYNWMEVPASAVEVDKLNNYDWPEPSVGLTRAECR